MCIGLNMRVHLFDFVITCRSIKYCLISTCMINYKIFYYYHIQRKNNVYVTTDESILRLFCHMLADYSVDLSIFSFSLLCIPIEARSPSVLHSYVLPRSIVRNNL